MMLLNAALGADLVCIGMVTHVVRTVPVSLQPSHTTSIGQKAVEVVEKIRPN